MANANVTRVGQVNGSGDVDALFLKVFAGEVLTAYEQATVMKDRVLYRTIANGKSASFPASGRITASYHTPGTEITGKTLPHAETIITIDDLLISDAFIANIDEAKNHYDVRSIYSTEIGRALAQTMDKHQFQVGIKAARAANVVTGLPGGSSIYQNSAGAPASANFATNGAHLAQALFLAAQTLDEKNVAPEGRTAFVRPAQYYALASTLNNINKDWGGAGAYSDGTVIRIAGIEIVKTNNLPNGVVANGTVEAGTANRYAGDYSNVAALVMHQSAIGTVKLMDLGMEAAYDIRRQGHLMVAKYAVGHGVLRPDAAVEIVAAASA